MLAHGMRMRSGKSYELPIKNGLVFWLDGVDLKGNEATNISSWANKASNNNALAKGTPKIKKANGLNTASMQGDDIYFEVNNVINARSVFIVSRNTSNPAAGRVQHILGGITDYDFHGADLGDNQNLLYSPQYSAIGLKNGQHYVNSISKTMGQMMKPRELSLISLIASNNLKFATISKDRHNSNRTWLGEYAEIIIYDRPINEEERLKIEGYLIGKWDTTNEGAIPKLRVGENLIDENTLTFDTKVINNKEYWITDGYATNHNVLYKASGFDTASQYVFGVRGIATTYWNKVIFSYTDGTTSTKQMGDAVYSEFVSLQGKTVTRVLLETGAPNAYGYLEKGTIKLYKKE